MVFNKNLTIGEGGILPFSHLLEKDTWFSRTFKTFCEENKIPLNKRLSDVSENDKNLLLKGTGDKEYYVEGENKWGRETVIREPFRGILNELREKYQSTESMFLRAQIERFMRFDFIKNATEKITKREEEIAKLIIKEIKQRLSFLLDVGLDYLTLSRGAQTLAGGEAQRIRLASQIGSGLTGVLYVLDEPSIGLHQRDNRKLIDTLKKLRDLGNTVLVVEHDQETMEDSDYIVDFGPGAGENGGNIISKGTVEEIKKDKNSITGEYLSGRKQIRSIASEEKSNGNPL